MPVVSSEAWLEVAARRKAVRDDVRNRFRESCGVMPLKSIQDMSAAPADQVGVVAGLIAATAAKATPDIASALASVQTALTTTGLGLGPAGTLATTALNLENLVPQGLFGGHFLAQSWDGIA